MRGEGSDTARLLFVLSNDFGELSNAMRVIAGSRFHATLLMPERLFAVNRDRLAVPAVRYASLADVTAAIDRERPDVVFLFSGYLYPINQIFDLAAVETLVRELRRRRVPFATTDPFLGALAAVDHTTFSDRHPAKEQLVRLFSSLASIFRNVIHVDLARLEHASGRRVAFYSDRLPTPPEASPPRAGDLGTPHWLFVLALEDYSAQVSRHGRARFDGMLLDTLADAARAGRQPVLLAPEVCVAALQARHPSIEGLVMHTFCDYRTFAALLREAEYAFYWNIFSNSVPVRGVGGQPVFFFARGHMAEAIPPVYERGVAAYWAGRAPDCLDQRRRLNAAELAVLAAGQGPGFAAARARFHALPSPEDMVASIIAEEARQG